MGTCLYGGDNVLDGPFASAWGEGSTGLPTTEYLGFHFVHPQHSIEVELAAGWQRDKCTYTRNARPKTVPILGDGLGTRDYSIKDGLGQEKIPVHAVAGASALKLEFTSVTAGTGRNGCQPADDMLVSEVGFLARTPTLWQR